MITVHNNIELLEALDKESISLQDYISMLIDKELYKRGVIQGESAEDVLKELEA